MPSDSGGQPEQFGTPEITSLASLTDGRAVGEYHSAYPATAWIQIVAELSYLLLVVAISFGALVLLAKYVVLKEASGPVFALIGPQPSAAPLVIYAAATFAGRLYHPPNRPSGEAGRERSVARPRSASLRQNAVA